MRSPDKMQLPRQAAISDSNSHPGVFAASNLAIESPSFTRLPSFRPIDSSVSSYSLDATSQSKGTPSFKLGAILATAVAKRGQTRSHKKHADLDERLDSRSRTHEAIPSSNGNFPGSSSNGNIRQNSQRFYTLSRSSSILPQISMSQDNRNRFRGQSQRNRRRLPGHAVAGVNEGNPHLSTVSSIPTLEDEGSLNSYELDFLRFSAEGNLTDLRNIFIEQSYYLFHLNVNCVDSLDRTALSLALLNRHLDVVRFLLSDEVGGLELRDALFYAVECEFYEAIELLLEKDSQTTLQIVPGTTSPFEPGLTPFMLSANKNNYKILSMLYKYNHRLTVADNEILDQSFDAYSWDAVMARLLHFRARASPAFILLMYNEKGLSWDPLNTSMDLFGELRLLAKREREVDEAYLSMSDQCETFALQLLQEVRSASELADLMRYDLDDDPDDDDDPGETDRVIIQKRQKMRNYLKPIEKAIKYKMKDFVTSDNSQLALIYIQKGNLFRKLQGHKAFFAQAFLGMMFPFLSIFYLVAPDSKWGRLMRNPTVKFACSVVSELIFVFLLLINTILTQYSTKDKRDEIPSLLIVAYFWIVGKFVQELREILHQGVREYLSDVWNYNDMATIILFSGYMLLRILNKAIKGNSTYYPWPVPSLSPIPLSDVCISIAYILIHLRILELLRAERRFGPLQVSLDLMTRDAIRFFVIFFIIYLAFGSGITELYAPFGSQNDCCCDGPPPANSSTTTCAAPCKASETNGSSNATHTASISTDEESLTDLLGVASAMFWTLFGYAQWSVNGGVNSQCIEHQVTTVVGTIILCLYHIIAIIVLVNMLIAMMSNSFQKTHDDAEREWKFHRTQLWLKFIRNEICQPPPMNLIPRPKMVRKLFATVSGKIRTYFRRQQEDSSAIDDNIRMHNQMRMNRRRTGFDVSTKMTETLAGAMYEGETRYSKVLRLVVIRYLKKKVLNNEMVV